MAFQVRVEGGAAPLRFSIEDPEDCLLRGALRAGVGFPHECNVGGCGSCKFDLLEGSVETAWAEAPGLSPRDRQRGKHLACQSRPLSDLALRVRLGDEHRPPIRARRQAARLLGARPLTHDMSEFAFATAGPAEFVPGQYALLELPATRGPRAYSMSNLPGEAGRWEFIVRRVPGGAGSAAVFDRLAVSDEVLLDGPYGQAYLRPSPREIVCVAGGSGLAPMLSIARAACRADAGPSAGGGPRLHFFFGGRTTADLCAEAELRQLPGFGNDLCFHPVVSAGTPDDGWGGARGFVHQALAARLPQPLPAYEFYFAGPPPMASAVQRLLMVEHQVPFGQIHFDRYF